MTSLQQRLFEKRDEQYAAFQSKLTPGIAPEKMIGVRVPILRKFAGEFSKEPACERFLKTLPHEYYDENMLHALLISQMKDYSAVLSHLEAFLPYVDNWAVCDILSPKIFKKHTGELIQRIRQWVLSQKTYTCRFGIEMLMSFYLDENFKPEYLAIPACICSDEYYVRMMVAWFFATALAKQWDSTIPYLEDGRLDVWTHNKTIQKARESFRITAQQKAYLKALKRGK